MPQPAAGGGIRRRRVLIHHTLRAPGVVDRAARGALGRGGLATGPRAARAAERVGGTRGRGRRVRQCNTEHDVADCNSLRALCGGRARSRLSKDDAVLQPGTDLAASCSRAGAAGRPARAAVRARAPCARRPATSGAIVSASGVR